MRCNKDLHVLCYTTGIDLSEDTSAIGNFNGLGAIRREELYKATSSLGIPSKNVTVLDDEGYLVSTRASWPVHRMEWRPCGTSRRPPTSWRTILLKMKSIVYFSIWFLHCRSCWPLTTMACPVIQTTSPASRSAPSTFQSTTIRYGLQMRGNGLDFFYDIGECEYCEKIYRRSR